MSNRDQFIAMYTPAAQRVSEQLRVPVDGVLNHWGLETGWGKSVIPGTNNLGNIKDFKGGGVAATDNMLGTRDRYRRYNSVDDFADDYAKLIGTNPRYARAINTDTVYDFANGLQKGGYAEDPNFARKVAGMPIGGNQVEVQPRLNRSLLAAGYPIDDASLGEVRSSKIPAEALAQIQAMNQERASMLPLALGGMISSNRGSQNFGNNLFGEARKAMNPIQTEHGMMIGDQYLTDDSAANLRAQATLLHEKNAQENNGILGGGTVTQIGVTPDGKPIFKGKNPTAFTYEGGQAVPYSGGVDNKSGGQPTEDERKSATYAQRIEGGQKIIDETLERNPKAATQSMLPRALEKAVPIFGDDAANFFTSKDRQAVEAAQLDMLDAALTLNTGAAYTKEQLRGLSKSYFPQPGDDENTVKTKKSILENLLAGAKLRGGRALKQNSGNLQTPSIGAGASNGPSAEDPLGLGIGR